MIRSLVINKYLGIEFILAISMFVIVGAMNVRDVGNSDNGRTSLITFESVVIC